jgi:Flp pilus assembly protein TadB
MTTKAERAFALDAPSHARSARRKEPDMRTTSEQPRRQRPWGAAFLGSAAVALSVAVVIWTASNAIVATIGIIAVVTIAVLALWTGRQRSCRSTSSTPSRG